MIVLTVFLMIPTVNAEMITKEIDEEVDFCLTKEKHLSKLVFSYILTRDYKLKNFLGEIINRFSYKDKISLP